MADKKKNFFLRHKVLTVIFGLIILLIIGAAAGGSKNTNSNGSSSSSSNNTVKTYKIGEPARDGKFEFTVTSIQCGKPNVGSDYTTKTAQGQYCLLNLSVKNIGDQAQSLFSSNQYLFNSQNQKYSADDTATLYNSPNDSSWYSDINPGNSVSGAIVFDIPKDVTPTSAELHDSAASGGVKVNLQ